MKAKKTTAKVTAKADVRYDERPRYRITGKSARAALVAAGIDPTDAAAMQKAEKKGGGVGELVRHTRKWLPTDTSEVVIRLSVAEASALKAHKLPLTSVS